MLKRFMALALAGICTLAASAEFRWGPTVSANFNTYHFKQKLIDIKSSTGGNAGILGELMFPGIGFGVDIGMQYALHGAKLNLGQKEVWSSDGYGNEQFWLHSIQIPLHLRYKFTALNGLERTIAPLAYIGPNFSFNVADNNLKAVDYPAVTIIVQFGLGVELWEHLQVTGCYNLGVSYEVRTLKLDNFSGQPRTWQVGLTYLF